MADPAESPAEVPVSRPLDDTEDRLWAALAHLGGIVGIVPALVIFLAFRRRSPLTRAESKGALNWQITWILVYIVVAIVGLVIAASDTWAVPVVLGIVYLVNVVFSILGFTRVNRGGNYRYPLAFRFIG